MKYTLFKEKNIAIMLLTVLLSLLIGTTTMQIYPNAKGLFDDDLQVSSTGEVSSNADGSEDAFGKIIEKYKGVITFVSGIGAITMIGIFIFHFMKLGSTASNPSERAKVTTGLIWSGLAAAGLGAVSLIVGVFYGLLRD